MLRYYLDSNIYRLCNPKHLKHNPKLLDLMKKLGGKILFVYSDAHLEDLKKSLKQYRDEDLDWMGQFVGDTYFYHDYINSKVTSYLAKPKEAFYHMDKESSDDFNLDLFNNPEKVFENDDLGDEMRPLLEFSLNSLRSVLDSSIKIFGHDENTFKGLKGKQLQLLKESIPNYNLEMTVGDLMKDFTPYLSKIMTQKEELDETRKLINEIFDRDDYKFEKWKMEFDQKFETTEVKKTFKKMIDDIYDVKNWNDFFLKFKMAYYSLELFNITVERTGGKRKKFTLADLDKDAAHAYYGIFSDFLVTDDKGLQTKAHILYKLFNIETKVLSVSDFLNRESFILSSEEKTFSSFINALVYDLKHAMQLFTHTNLESGIPVRSYKTNHTYFNYFNRIQTFVEYDPKVFALYCSRTVGANWILYRELEILINKLLIIFGLDIEAKGRYELSEKVNNGDPIRIWRFQVFEIWISVNSAENGNYIVLTFDRVS